MISRLKRVLARIVKGGEKPETPAEEPNGFFDDLALARITEDDWISKFREGRFFYTDIPDEAVASIKGKFTGPTVKTVELADTIIEHKFDLLGSGQFVPVDPDRQANDGYIPINWLTDPVEGVIFPSGFHHKKWNMETMRPGLADIKHPWELSRCQHFTALGQAYRLTGEEKYASEIVNQIRDFMEANPVGMGVNWVCTMDVAIRAANMAIGLTMIRSCQTIPEKVLMETCKALYDHGIFIFRNFENNYEVTSNHYLSNITGLYYLATMFGKLPQAAEWKKHCRKSLEEEIELQILNDGADYESSVPYHRLVTELFMGPARLAEFCGEPLSERYLERLRCMVEFMAGVMRPDRLTPQIGDADDGRLHILAGYGDYKPQDTLHLFGPAAFLLDNKSWLSMAGERELWEAAWWGYDVNDVKPSDSLPPDNITAYRNAGLYVARRGENYLLISNSIVGTKGFGNHKHNDQLSFEYHVDGSPLIVDPGSYVYTSDPDARNLFRSNTYHNTVTIDGAEQNEMNREWLFRLFEKANPETLEWEAGDERVRYRGVHTGYMELSSKITHERTFDYKPDSGGLFISDRLTGDGAHTATWHFHLSPGVSANLGKGACLLSVGGAEYRIEYPGKLEARISDVFYSPSYGVKIPCKALDLSCYVDQDESSSWFFAIGSNGWLDNDETRTSVEKARSAMNGTSR